MSYIFITSISLFFTEGVSVVYLGFLNIHIMCAGGDYLSLLGGGGVLSSACQFQSNPRKLTRSKLLMKHMHTILLT